MADELAASNDREYILGCIRALLQTFVSDTAPINWIQPVDSERTKLFLNILRFPSPEDAAKYESLFSNLKNRKDSWLSFPERDCSVFDGITNMIIVPWPRTALHRLAIYLGCMDKLWPYLREILLEMCLETKCEECGKVSYKVPVMEFFDLQAVACAECGHLTDQAWCAEGYILGQGFREFFSMARLVNLIQINCAGLSFHETIPVCISAADKLQDFRKRFIEFIKKEVQPCNKKIINIDFEHNIAETLSNPAEGYFNLDFSLTNKLAGLEEEFISAFRSFLDSYYDSM
ncbi:MAG TPA: hypothetical protein ENO22_13980 [candidate division Zixibacteria bacterium]|nr:hypothetical protein [candidate division Zixibacteria bacterium]